MALLRILDELVTRWQEPWLQVRTRRSRHAGGVVLLEPPPLVDEQPLAAARGCRARGLRTSASGDEPCEEENGGREPALHRVTLQQVATKQQFCPRFQVPLSRPGPYFDGVRPAQRSRQRVIDDKPSLAPAPTQVTPRNQTDGIAICRYRLVRHSPDDAAPRSCSTSRKKRTTP